MIISVASGKGGTGKTTIATNLAAFIARTGKRVAYLDCDVEEPNGRIFLDPHIGKKLDVTVPVPRIDSDKCTFCGECSAACEYNALAVLPKSVEVFASLCHSCGGCSLACRENAITEIPRAIGQISCGLGAGVEFFEGRLNVGEALSPPVTKELKKFTIPSGVNIIDTPPGTSCPVLEAVNGSDFVVLVTEPTPFGLNDLKLAAGMVRALDLPFGVIVNRSNIGDDRIEKYCMEENIEILQRIPFNRRLAEAYSRGEMMFDIDSEYDENLENLFDKIKDRISHDRIGNCQR